MILRLLKKQNKPNKKQQPNEKKKQKQKSQTNKEKQKELRNSYVKRKLIIKGVMGLGGIIVCLIVGGGGGLETRVCRVGGS